MGIFNNLNAYRRSTTAEEHVPAQISITTTCRTRESHAV
jgi:hypothetical protein